MTLLHLRRLHSTRAVSSHDAIARTLGQEILKGVHPQGANLPPEANLLARFKVSRTVLREVMKTLSAKGLVELKTRVGTRVLNSSNWNFFDAELLAWRAEIGIDADLRRSLAEIRRAVEPNAAALAAKRRTRADIAYMRDCVERMGQSEGDAQKFAEADLEFHLMIGIASGNPMMRSLAAVIEAALFASFQQNMPLEGMDLEETSSAHGAIVDAIEARDEEAAHAAMERVIDIGQTRITKRIRARSRNAKSAKRP